MNTSNRRYDKTDSHPNGKECPAGFLALGPVIAGHEQEPASNRADSAYPFHTTCRVGQHAIR